MNDHSRKVTYTNTMPTLRDAHGKATRFLAVEDVTDTSISATLYDIVSWSGPNYDTPDDYELLSPFYVKWDGCCHIGLRNEGMNWVHICGPEHFETTMAAIRWARIELQNMVEAYDPQERVFALPIAITGVKP